MKKTSLKEKLKMIKAALLSGTIMLTSTGCGNVDDKEYNKDLGARPTITKEITEEPTTLEEEIQAIEKTTGKKSTTIIEEITEDNTELTTQTNITEPTTTTTQQSETSTNHTEPTKTTPETTTETTITTSITLPIDDLNERHNGKEQVGPVEETTTKATTTTQTTTKATTTKATTTDIPEELKTHTKIDMKSKDDVVASIAFEQMASGLDKDLFGNYLHQNQYGETAHEACDELVAILNYNQGINKSMLANWMFSYTSEEEFLQLCDNLNFADYQVFYKTNIDFKKYVIDEKFAETLNRVCAEYRDYKNGNKQPLEQELEKYFSTTHTNYVEYYFMANTKAMTQKKSGIYKKTLDVEAQQLFFDNVARPFYNDFMQYKEKSYTK